MRSRTTVRCRILARIPRAEAAGGEDEGGEDGARESGHGSDHRVALAGIWTWTVLLIIPSSVATSIVA